MTVAENFECADVVAVAMHGRGKRECMEAMLLKALTQTRTIAFQDSFFFRSFRSYTLVSGMRLVNRLPRSTHDVWKGNDVRASRNVW